MGIDLDRFVWYDTEWLIINVTMAGAELLGYGIHMVLFILAMFILTRRKTAGKKLLLIYTVAMALFGTTQVVLNVAEAVCTVQLFVQGGTTSSRQQLRKAVLALDLAQTFVFFANNLVSDSLLLYRCFIIWGSRWPPVVLPGILIVATCIVGYGTTISEISHRALAFDAIAPYVFAAVATVVLMVFTVGRIWWIRRDALRVCHGGEVLNRYNTAIAMILESGALYFFPTIILLIPMPLVPRAIITGIATHLINIAPTLIVVRVGLGHDIQGTVQSLPGNAASTRPPAQIPVPLQPPSPQMLHIKQSEDDDLWTNLKTDV
ncbi:hypothetical protein C8F04DRAFT_1136275 [Mycena alexandri]|uniref:Uncharacterized protein n=1 Tax=Mycena alexandri TaxID=1745969 RepID=A0AAD6SAY6_9AGAR|nr:hypothetical protein C8F04DRAFT_1136275 [Mycena alexandri]